MNGPLRKGRNKSNNLYRGSLSKYGNKSRNPFKGPYKKEAFAISLAVLIALLIILLSSSLTGGSAPVQQTNQTAANQTATNQTPQIPTQTYAANGISFQYPNSWNITTNQINGSNMQIMIQDPASASNPQSAQVSAFFVDVEKNPSNTLEQQKDTVIQSLTNNGANIALSSTSNTTVNNINAAQAIYSGNDANYNKIQVKVVYFEQNGVFYILAFFTKGMDLESQNTYFNIILNSFRTQ